MCIVKLRHEVKCSTCRFFIGPRDDPGLMGMADIKLPNILRKTCKVISLQHENMKFDSQIIDVFNSSSCKTKRAQQYETDKVGTYDNNTNMSDYFRSSTNKAVERIQAIFDK